MKALVYHGPGKRAWEEKPMASLKSSTDAVVRVLRTTICGTDLHILKGDLPEVTSGRILGHEGIGVIEEVGTAVTSFKKGDRVIISCVTSCGKCVSCKRAMYSHCLDGGWILGYMIDGTQAEYVRIPHADGSLYLVPPGVDEDALVMLSDILPTGFECGVLNGSVQPGDTVAIIGAGPVGLAALLTAQFYSPSELILVDVDDNRLEVSRKFGATKTINSSDGNAAAKIMAMTKDRGVDVTIEAVGVRASFDICQAIVAAGGHIANIGVHGKSVELHLERLWSRNITLTTRLVDTSTTPMLLKTVEAKTLRPEQLITHRFTLDDMSKAYETFGNAAREHALKVLISAALAARAGGVGKVESPPSVAVPRRSMRHCAPIGQPYVSFATAFPFERPGLRDSTFRICGVRRAILKLAVDGRGRGDLRLRGVFARFVARPSHRRRRSLIRFVLERPIRAFSVRAHSVHSQRGPMPASAHSGTPTGVLVLVVEDDEDTRDLYIEALSAMGYRTAGEPDGAAGVETALRIRPDAVLMDISMPILNGLDATRRLKEDPRTSGSLVILMTGHGMDKFEEARAAGCDAFFCKPFDPIALQEVLRTLASPVEQAKVHVRSDIVKECTCGRRFALKEWMALRSCGRMHVPLRGVVIELRTCPCGSSLSVELDDLGNAVVRSSPAEAPRAATEGGAVPHRVLVADRDPHIRRLLQQFLGEAYALEFADDGYSALDRVRKCAPAAVVTEILIPRLDGLALCRSLKGDATTRGVPILVISMLAAEERALQSGADAFLAKPLEKTTFVASVSGLVEQMKQAGALPPPNRSTS